MHIQRYREEIQMEDPRDSERIRDALRFYVERVNWSSADRAPGGERAQYMRLLERYTIEVGKR